MSYTLFLQILRPYDSLAITTKDFWTIEYVQHPEVLLGLRVKAINNSVDIIPRRLLSPNSSRLINPHTPSLFKEPAITILIHLVRLSSSHLSLKVMIIIDFLFDFLFETAFLHHG